MLLYFAALIGMIKQGLLITLLLIANSFAFSQYSIQSVPDPKSQGQDYFVSDPDGILGYDAADSLNKLCASIEKTSSAEVAIVVINDFKGSSDFDFAYDLFNHWGIGKAENNNGLLLFIAKDRRKYQFITGYGMEGTLTDVTLGAIGENYLVPKFRKNDYGGGVIDAMNAVKNILSDPDSVKELKAEMRKRSFWYKNQSPLFSLLIVIVIFLALYRWMGIVEKQLKIKKKTGTAALATGLGCAFFAGFASIFIIGFIGIRGKDVYNIKNVPWIVGFIANIILFARYSYGRTAIIDSHKDEENIVHELTRYNRQMFLPMLLAPLSLFFLIGYYIRKNKLKYRLQPPDDSGKWVRLNRDTIRGISAYLNEGQQKEEKLKSVSYEIWQHADDAAIKLVAWNGRKYNRYEDCPKCRHHTLNQVYTRTIKAPTYSSTGIGEKIQDCAFCDYKQTFGTVVLPKKVESSSSSGSGSSGRSSSSSGGSWGGGRSGGGGAGGSW